MIKLLQLLNELEVKNPNEPTKEGFIKYVKNYYHILNKLDPLIQQRYAKKYFNGLADIIIKELSKLGKANEEFMNWSNFKNWIKGIDKEDLPYGSSGSFVTALFDTDYIYDEGDVWGLTEEECEDLALNSHKF